MDCLPSAQRGSLLLRQGERLVYAAATGARGALPGPLTLHADAGPASALAPLAAAEGPRVVPAAAWYRAHLPDGPALDLLPQGAAVALTPVRVHGQPIGVIALDLPAEAAPAGEPRARLVGLADAASAVLERRELYDDRARSAYETRLLEDVLNAVAARASPHRLVEIISNGIKSVQLAPRWRAVTLVMLDEAARGGAPAGAPGQDRVYRVYRVPRRAPVAYWNNIRDGALFAGRHLGVHVDFRIGIADRAATLNALVDEGIRRRVHGIAVPPVDPTGLEPAIRRAAEAGIPVVAFDTPPAEGSRAAVYIGTDNLSAGRLAGEMMARLLPGGGNVAAQVASARTINGMERVEGLRAAVADRAIAVEPPSEDLFDTSLGLRLAEEALQRRPLAGAFGACAQNGPSFAMAARALGRGGELKVVAFDLLIETVAMLREGLIHAAVVQREHEMGYRSVQVLHDMISRGVEATLAGLPPPRDGARRSPRFIDTGVDVVTLERTPWSCALSDYMTLDTSRRAANRRRECAGASRSMEILVVGVNAEEVDSVEESARLEQGSLVERALRTAKSVVLDVGAGGLDRSADAAEARRSGTRTLVGVPLLARGGAFGVLVLDSERKDACSPEDLALIERVADTLAVAIENGQLLQRITERTHELERSNQQQESLLSTIVELSSPVVPIAHNILVMPIVGTMDTRRSGRFIESMLHEIAERHARVVLIDVTGMAAVDSVAAHHLVTAARAARLLGAEVVLVGITPAAARTIVDQGIDLEGVVTRSTLELGFTYALSKTGGRIHYSQPA
ncbi:substrate-binding domain-containing protein [Sorangium sp. So ce131]|uniref:substrate-binding domain-containing protein n=1 Tax=Sorangium sp. So ce131 TaxID=3133282 RepID=UPI003F611F69